MPAGSSVPIYIHMGESPDTGIAGTLVFQDVPNASDCHGVLYWAKPPKAKGQYPEGFEMGTQFKASQVNRVIGGLSAATFTATGSDLTTPFTASIPLIRFGNLNLGTADKVHLTISRFNNTFYGTFADPTTHLSHPFSGVLLTKSRTGAGLFFSESLSGTVAIQY